MKNRILMALLTMLTSVVMLTPVVSAADVFQHLDCSGKAKSSALCQDKNTSTNPLTGSNGVIIKITNIIAIIAGVAAVIIIILSGLRFVTGGGDANEVAGARRSIVYAVVGLVVIAVARFIIGLIVSKL